MYIMSLRVELDKGLEERFRETAMRRYGFSKGAIKKATEEAAECWLNTTRRDKSHKKKAKGVVKSMRGLLKDVKGKTSVELKHEATKIWAANVLKKSLKQEKV